MHSTQLPAPSHSVPVPTLQATPEPNGGLDAWPPLQRSCVHGLLSTGRSLSLTALMTSPSMQVSLWQSPGEGFPTTVPLATLVKPQVPFTQTLTWQAFGGAGQLASVMHPTQFPLPSHIRAPPQLVPRLTFGFDATPLMQTSSVHGFPSTGRSLLSTP